MRARRIAVACALLAALQGGCGVWHRLRPVPEGPLPLRQQAQVFHHGGVARWHAVVATQDSISGIPFIQPPGCDACRVALPRSAVDSVRVGNPEARFASGLGIGLLTFLSLMFVLCSAWGCPAPD